MLFDKIKTDLQARRDKATQLLFAVDTAERSLRVANTARNLPARNEAIAALQKAREELIIGYYLDPCL